jgi:hypothetical protein
MTEEKHEIPADVVEGRFRSMVLLPVEWAFAAVPPMVVLYLVAIGVSVALDPILGPLPHWWSARSTADASLMDFAPLVANH